MPQKPWEKYQQQAGPWNKYQQPAEPSDTLLESRREASRMEFEKNLPQSTFGSRVASGVLGAAEGMGVSPQPTALGTIGKTALNIGEFVKLMGEGQTNPMARQQLLEGVISGVTSGPKEIAQGVSEGDWDKAAHGAGQTITGTLPVAYGAGKGVAGAVKPAAKYGTERLGSSIVKPLEANKEFGATPVKAFNENVGFAPTMKAAVGKITEATAATEGRLMQAAAKYASNKADIAPAMKTSAQKIIKELKLDGKDAVAKQIDKMVDRRIAEIKTEHGTTVLNPMQIIQVKRGLKKGIAFTEDVTQQSLNSAKMAAYRAVDNTLDNLTKGETKPINQEYASLIEAEGRLKERRQQMMNRDFTSVKGTIGSLIERLPSTAAKTALIQVLRMFE